MNYYPDPFGKCVKYLAAYGIPAHVAVRVQCIRLGAALSGRRQPRTIAADGKN